MTITEFLNDKEIQDLINQNEFEIIYLRSPRASRRELTQIFWDSGI